MTPLTWNIIPGGIVAKAPIPNGEVEYTITRYGADHKWQIQTTIQIPAKRPRGRPKKRVPRRTTSVVTTTVMTVNETHLMAMKELSQDDYESRIQ